MSFLNQVAVLILTKNEAPNIGRTLAALERFEDVLVLDSGSDDATHAFIDASPNTRLAVRPFDSHANQWNHGLSLQPEARPWTLALDADYVLTPELVAEIAALAPDAATVGYRARFRYCIVGEPLSGSLYPPVIVLFRRDRGRYEQHGHTQRLALDGEVAPLAAPINHDDRKPLARWFASQIRYASLEVEYICESPPEQLRRIDRLRRRGWIAPLIVLPYTLLAKRCLFDGWRGWSYALQRLIAETMIALMVIERRLSRNRPLDP